jgi:RNA polymerase sigma-70 factor (ECF subfamily)
VTSGQSAAGGAGESPAGRGASTDERLAALERLYDAYHRQAFGLAYGLLGNLSDTEEVVQEVFLAAWRAGDSYDPNRGSTRTWLLSMVRNRCIDVLRARRRRPIEPLPETIDPPADLNVSEEAAAIADAATARAALAGLPVEQREVIELAYFRGLSHTEIAGQLSLPVGTVKGRIRLAMDRLRVALGVIQFRAATS